MIRHVIWSDNLAKNMRGTELVPREKLGELLKVNVYLELDDSKTGFFKSTPKADFFTKELLFTQYLGLEIAAYLRAFAGDFDRLLQTLEEMNKEAARLTDRIIADRKLRRAALDETKARERLAARIDRRVAKVHTIRIEDREDHRPLQKITPSDIDRVVALRRQIKATLKVIENAGIVIQRECDTIFARMWAKHVETRKDYRNYKIKIGYTIATNLLAVAVGIAGLPGALATGGASAVLGIIGIIKGVGTIASTVGNALLSAEETLDGVVEKFEAVLSRLPLPVEQAKATTETAQLNERLTKLNEAFTALKHRQAALATSQMSEESKEAERASIARQIQLIRERNAELKIWADHLRTTNTVTTDPPDPKIKTALAAEVGVQVANWFTGGYVGNFVGTIDTVGTDLDTLKSKTDGVYVSAHDAGAKLGELLEAQDRLKIEVASQREICAVHRAMGITPDKLGKIKRKHNPYAKLDDLEKADRDLEPKVDETIIKIIGLVDRVDTLRMQHERLDAQFARMKTEYAGIARTGSVVKGLGVLADMTISWTQFGVAVHGWKSAAEAARAGAALTKDMKDALEGSSQTLLVVGQLSAPVDAVLNAKGDLLSAGKDTWDALKDGAAALSNVDFATGLRAMSDALGPAIGVHSGPSFMSMTSA
ncbi:MAG: hypothetical protein ACK5WM_13575 [Rhodospirillales bacterium]|jgi:hypothetical protein